LTHRGAASASTFDGHLAAALRALAAIDGGAAERVIEGLARPADRALGWLVLTESAVA
jgi:hypothetical protein